MENMGRKAAILAAAFASVGALGAAYVYRHDIAFSIADVVHPEWNAGEARLADAYDRRYTLLNNGDGTETALYDDATAVTFRHDGAGDLVWLFGTASLLAPLAPNYFAFHGFSYAGGTMDLAQMTYRANAPLAPLPEKYTVSGTGAHGHVVNHSYAGRSYNEKKSEKSGEVSRRSGFGQAGIRSSGGS